MSNKDKRQERGQDKQQCAKTMDSIPPGATCRRGIGHQDECSSMTDEEIRHARETRTPAIDSAIEINHALRKENSEQRDALVSLQEDRDRLLVENRALKAQQEGHVGIATEPAPERTAANIPKAVHYLRRAITFIPMVRDPIGETLQTIAVRTIQAHGAGNLPWPEDVRTLGAMAAALDLDHNAADAAANVRAAIEALG